MIPWVAFGDFFILERECNDVISSADEAQWRPAVLNNSRRLAFVSRARLAD